MLAWKPPPSPPQQTTFAWYVKRKSNWELLFAGVVYLCADNMCGAKITSVCTIIEVVSESA